MTTTASSTTSQTSTGTQVAADETVHHKSRRKKDVEPSSMQLNLTSMIDVIFQLLIYFVITASFAAGEGVITAKLPKGSGNAADVTKPPEQPLNISIASTGTAGYRVNIESYGQVPANFGELAELLKQLQHNPDKGRGGVYEVDNPIVIKPDGRVRWQHVVNAFNATVLAGYSNVSFAQASE